MADSGSCRVLLVEDDHDTRDVMTRLLRRFACQVTPVATVGAALLHLEARGNGLGPTHVLLDLMLPDANGVVLLQAIRRRDLPLRVALVTAAGPDSRVVTEALNWRPDAIFHKPLLFADLEAWVTAK